MTENMKELLDFAFRLRLEWNEGEFIKKVNILEKKLLELSPSYAVITVRVNQFNTELKYREIHFQVAGAIALPRTLISNLLDIKETLRGGDINSAITIF